MRSWWDDGEFDRLKDLGLVGERERQQRRALRMGMAFADLDRVRPDSTAITSVPPELARELRTLPVKRDGRTLWVALVEPDSSIVQRIVEATGLRVIPVMCVASALDEALARL